MKLSVDKVCELYTDELAKMIEVTDGRDKLASILPLEYAPMLAELLTDDTRVGFEQGFCEGMEGLVQGLKNNILSVLVNAHMDEKIMRYIEDLTVDAAWTTGRRGELYAYLAQVFGESDYNGEEFLGVCTEYDPLDAVRFEVYKGAYAIGYKAFSELIGDCCRSLSVLDD